MYLIDVVFDALFFIAGWWLRGRMLAGEDAE